MSISVVIPCFNHGAFLQEAVNSVLASAYKEIEIIIIDDGSNDEQTLTVIEQYRGKGFKVLTHSNAGLAFSRNKGIEAATGKYILPLDADNRIRPDYINKAVALLDTGCCDIVYAKPHFFGKQVTHRLYTTGAFEISHLLNNNYIDACAVYRKTVWQATNGYDQNMPYQGMEDWEFWISSYFNNFKFEFIDEELFDYRISAGSMITSVINDKLEANHQYIIRKHKNNVISLINRQSVFEKFHQNDQRNYLRTSLKYLVKFLKHNLIKSS
jgi:glycosyltransferase involved in cell wall biosynthesis